MTDDDERRGSRPAGRGQGPRVAGFARALAVILAVLAAACGSPAGVPEKGAVLLRIKVPASGPLPDELRAWVYDDTGALFVNVRVPPQGALPTAANGDLGTILIQPGVVAGALRIHVRGLVASTRRLDGVISLGAADRDGSTVNLALGIDVLGDGDGDDVPDSIDDCPGVFNPDQRACSAPTSDGSVPSPDTSVGPDAQPTDGRPPAPDSGSGGGSGGSNAGSVDGGVDRAVADAGARDSSTDSGRADVPGTADGSSTTPDASLPAGGSAGCGIAATGVSEGLVTLMMTEGGASVARQFFLSRPATYDPLRAYKLIVGLGSAASSADVVRPQLGVQGTGVVPQSDEIFLYPLARVRTFGTWGTRTGWQLGAGARNTNAAGQDDVAFIDAMLDDVTRRHCIDKQRVFAVGHGWGSDFAHALACLRGNVIHAVTGSATNGDYYLVSPAVACAGAAATFTLHGKGDTALPLATGMTALDFWLNQQKCTANTQPLTVPGPNGNEACVRYVGCSAETRWCAYDASFGGGVPSYLGREAMNFFRGF